MSDIVSQKQNAAADSDLEAAVRAAEEAARIASGDTVATEAFKRENFEDVDACSEVLQESIEGNSLEDARSMLLDAPSIFSAALEEDVMSVEDYSNTIEQNPTCRPDYLRLDSPSRSPPPQGFSFIPVIPDVSIVRSPTREDLLKKFSDAPFLGEDVQLDNGNVYQLTASSMNAEKELAERFIDEIVANCLHDTIDYLVAAHFEEFEEEITASEKAMKAEQKAAAEKAAAEKALAEKAAAEKAAAEKALAEKAAAEKAAAAKSSAEETCADEKKDCTDASTDVLKTAAADKESDEKDTGGGNNSDAENAAIEDAGESQKSQRAKKFKNFMASFTKSVASTSNTSSFSSVAGDATAASGATNSDGSFEEMRRRAKEVASRLARLKEEQFKFQEEQKRKVEEEKKRKAEEKRLAFERQQRRGKGKPYVFSSISAGLYKKNYVDTKKNSPIKRQKKGSPPKNKSLKFHITDIVKSALQYDIDPDEDDDFELCPSNVAQAPLKSTGDRSLEEERLDDVPEGHMSEEDWNLTEVPRKASMKGPGIKRVRSSQNVHNQSQMHLEAFIDSALSPRVRAEMLQEASESGLSLGAIQSPKLIERRFGWDRAQRTIQLRARDGELFGLGLGNIPYPGSGRRNLNSVPIVGPSTGGLSKSEKSNSGENSSTKSRRSSRSPFATGPNSPMVGKVTKPRKKIPPVLQPNKLVPVDKFVQQLKEQVLSKSAVSPQKGATADPYATAEVSSSFVCTNAIGKNENEGSTKFFTTWSGKEQERISPRSISPKHSLRRSSQQSHQRSPKLSPRPKSVQNAERNPRLSPKPSPRSGSRQHSPIQSPKNAQPNATRSPKLNATCSSSRAFFPAVDQKSSTAQRPHTAPLFRIVPPVDAKTKEQEMINAMLEEVSEGDDADSVASINAYIHNNYSGLLYHDPQQPKTWQNLEQMKEEVMQEVFGSSGSAKLKAEEEAQQHADDPFRRYRNDNSLKGGKMLNTYRPWGAPKPPDEFSKLASMHARRASTASRADGRRDSAPAGFVGKTPIEITRKPLFINIKENPSL